MKFGLSPFDSLPGKNQYVVFGFGVSSEAVLAPNGIKAAGPSFAHLVEIGFCQAYLAFLR